MCEGVKFLGAGRVGRFGQGHDLLVGAEGWGVRAEVMEHGVYEFELSGEVQRLHRSARLKDDVVRRVDLDQRAQNIDVPPTEPDQR